MLGDTEGERRHDLEDVGHLGGRVERHVPAERLGDRRHRARFHGGGNQPLLDVALLHGVGRIGEGAVDITLGLLDLEVPGVRAVGADLVVDHHAVAQGVLEVDDRLEGLVLDVDGVEGVAGRGGRGGEHAGDPVTDVVGLAHRERVVGGRLHVVGHRPGARHRTGPRLSEVGPGEHGGDARHGCRRRGVDGDDARAGVWAAEHRQVQGARDREVSGVLGLAGQESGILAAQHSLAEHPGGVIGHGHR